MRELSSVGSCTCSRRCILPCQALLCRQKTAHSHFQPSVPPWLCPPCLRYVSEKLWNPFRAGTVPIYVGGHAEARQGRWLPEHSWIDASEFGSVRELAEHLVFLSKRPDE